MRALIAGPGGEGRLTEVPEPEPGPGQVLVEIRHASVNFSDLRHMSHLPEGTVLGYDAAGIVLRAAEDGTGPAVGARVAAFGPGVWAERAVFGTDAVAVVPADVDLATAAALPMAGLTALRSLRAAGLNVPPRTPGTPAPHPLQPTGTPAAPPPGAAGSGVRVLVTGASGAVGRLAVQLAALAGAHVIASVSHPGRARDLTARRAGTDAPGTVEVVTGLDGVDPVHVVVEVLGGPTLVTAWGLLEPGGNLQSIGWASGEDAVFVPNSTFSLGEARSLSSFGDVTAPAADLAQLLALMETGDLAVDVGLRVPWERPAEAQTAQLARTASGKIVLDVTSHQHP
ncbi:zinc-binding dehydrogenase [Nonomuraea rosea]|uniref:Zinc-binding dehydrogenase n=1 Tax=Nonomuraea rosea TaxID=638574 RepID=A0ABP6V8R5_9ACTN